MRSVLLPALSLGLLLSACGGNNGGLPASGPAATAPQTPVGKAPASTAPAKTSLGVYELQINNVRAAATGEKATAQMVRLGGSLSAQASEVGGLVYESTSTTTIADATKKVLHIVATFKVTNNSGADISVPTYVPIDTAGAGGTDGESPFKSVTNAKGVPIAPPAGMQVERAHQNSGTLIQPDPNATPLVENLDTAGLTLSLPAGTTAPGISHVGWQSALLPAGASQEVNFAVSVPLQGNDVSDADPFRFGLVIAVADNPGTISPALTQLGAVQGRTPAGDAASPKAGQTVTVEGVVTSVLPGLNGYFVQEAGLNADSDTDTSNGIFVYCGAGNTCPTLSSGDVVRVTGAVSEFGGATQLTASAATKLAAGVPLPEAVSLTLPFDKAAQERYEGMRVTFPETLTVTNNFTYGRYGQLDLSSGGRMFNPTNGNAKTGQSLITLDDGQSVQNPLNLPYLNAAGTRRTGDTVTGLSGIWHAVANQAMLEPEGPVNFVDANPREAAPKDVGGTLRVGGANVLNYFTDLNGSYSSSGPRGANTAAELQRQRTKMANTLTTLNADVLTLMEVQNNGDTALNDIVAALNEKAGAGTYAAVRTGTVGTDAIKVAIIYKPGKVVPVGQPVIDTNSVYSRPPVAQTFWDKTTGGKFTVIANHLKSKGSCPTSGDVDSGQGCWNNLRVQQAQQLLKLVSSLKASTGDQDVMVMGDLNAYGDEDPIKAIVAGGFESLNKRIPAEDRYSYQFGGLFGYLDHALASTNLSAQVTGITEWHVNSDEPTIADYNTEFKAIPECVKGAGGNANACQGKDLFDASNPFRASDHDPVLVGLNLTRDSDTAPTNPATATLSASPSALTVTAGGAAQSSTLTLSTQNYSGANLNVSVSGNSALTLTPSAATVSPNGTFTVSVIAPAGTAAGSYPVTVTATGEGGLSASTTINVTVSADAPPPATGLNHLLISQVYGGGGNSGATFTHDFIELFNPTSANINLSGYQVEYFSKAGGSGGKTALSGTVKAGGYFLIQQASTAAVGAPLPTPDATGTLAMSGTDGSVSLLSGTTVVDLMGYGAATKFEGAATPALSATKAAIRTNVCADSDNNRADFTVTTPAPRNTSTAPATCTVATN